MNNDKIKTSSESPVYVILQNTKKEKYLNRMSFEIWEKVKLSLDPKSIIYVTKDIHDSEIQTFDTINYNSIFHPLEKKFHYIKIPFTPDNIEFMNIESEKKYNELKEKYDKEVFEKEERRKARIQKKHDENEKNGNYEKLLNAQIEADSLIPIEMNEMDAIYKWRELNYQMPAAHRIAQIKESYNMSWSEFKLYIQNNF